MNVGTWDQPVWFAPEHLRILPYQIYKRPVPDHLTRGMLDVACQPPERSKALIQMEGLKNLGVDVATGLVSLVSSSYTAR